MEPVSLEQFQKTPFPEELEEYIILDSRYNHSFRAAFELLGKGKTVYRNRGHPDFSPGSFLVRKSEALDLLKAIHKAGAAAADVQERDPSAAIPPPAPVQGRTLPELGAQHERRLAALCLR